MLRALIISAALVSAQQAAAHAIFPGIQTVRTTGERAFVTFHAVNGRTDVKNFMVEIFDFDTWRPYRMAVATPDRLVVPAQISPDEPPVERSISVLVDLEGKRQQHLRVCTKSVADPSLYRQLAAHIATRACASVTVERF